MPGLYSKYIKLIHATGDVVLITVTAVITRYLYYNARPDLDSSIQTSHILYLVTAWLVCATLSGAYKFARVSNNLSIILNILKVMLLYVLLIEATLNILSIIGIPRNYLNYYYLFLVFSIVVWRATTTFILKEYRKRGYNYRKAIIVGHGAVGMELMSFFNSHPEHGYRFLGFFDNKSHCSPEVIGTVEDVSEFVLENNVDEIYCSPFELNKEQLNSLTEFVDKNLVRLKLLPEPGEFPYKRLRVDFYDILPVLMVRTIPLDDAVNKFLKRTFDITFSLIAILFLLSWLLPLLALIIKLDSKGPVFFKQERSGIDNKTFSCWKLRSMYVNTEANLQQARRGDARITKVGAFLRRTSLDELPQFFNVLMGQMSVVGPRPHMLKHTQEYAASVDKFMVRHFIKPGITGLSQVRGYRGDTSEAHQMKGRVRLDIFYLENWSLLLDLKIIFYTIYNAVKGEENAF